MKLSPTAGDAGICHVCGELWVMELLGPRPATTEEAGAIKDRPEYWQAMEMIERSRDVPTD
jgi:hypothetical protein